MSDCSYCGGRGVAKDAAGVVRCRACEELYRRGMRSRDWALPLESCPWASGHAVAVEPGGPAVDLSELLGDPRDAHGLTACPWCRGWADRELEFFRGACRGGEA